MKTILGTEMKESVRGVLYLGTFNGKELKVVKELLFEDAGNALWAYAEIPNPPSQLATGKTYEELCTSLRILHKNIKDKKWLERLAEEL